MYSVDVAYVQYGTCTCFGKKREVKLTMHTGSGTTGRASYEGVFMKD